MINRNSAVMTVLFHAAGVAPKQETVLLHDAVDPLPVGRRTALGAGLSAKMRPDADKAPGRLPIDHGLDLFEQIGFRP